MCQPCDTPPHTHTVPTPEQVAAMAPTFVPPPRPVPVLGYACLNMTLREKVKPPVYTNRDCTKKTLEARGIDYLSELTLQVGFTLLHGHGIHPQRFRAQNVLDLVKIVQYNHEHGIRLFRLSSNMVPWMSAVRDLRNLKDFDAIASALRHAGDLVRVLNEMRGWRSMQHAACSV